MLEKEQKDPRRIGEEQAPFEPTLIPVTAVETRHWSGSAEEWGWVGRALVTSQRNGCHM